VWALVAKLVALASLTAAGGDGRPASAWQIRPAGFFTRGPTPYTDFYEDGSGRVSIEVVDRIDDERAVRGDSARMEAQFRVGGDSYLLELERVGGERVRTFFRHPVFGGVILDTEIYGYSGLGSARTTQAHAALALWGLARVLKNGRVCAESAPIHAAALSSGTHADDGTHRLLPEARETDAEIHVLVEQLPVDCTPAGFIEFWFDDVQIEVDGIVVPAVPFVDTVPARNPDEQRAYVAAQPPAYYGQVPGLYAFQPTASVTPTPSPFTGTVVTRIPPEPLIRMEPPLNSQPSQPLMFPELSRLVSTPQPLNAQPATPLIRTPTPLSSQPATFGIPPANLVPATTP
jgi:hypothetical protein